VLKYVASLGCGIDCSSINEVKLALHAGVLPEKILYTSNGIDFEEIEEAVQCRVHINIDSLSNLEKFGKKVIIGGVSQLPLKANFIEFTKADFKAAFADVVFTYPEENIQVEAKFSKKNNKWTRVSSKIKEMK
ncbi:MAG: hypothetical protein EOO48_13780, partial [Flavobacterium sp.]